MGGERNFRSDRINTVSDKNHACRNDGGEGRVEGQSSACIRQIAVEWKCRSITSYMGG